jgi:hypothetical protein
MAIKIQARRGTAAEWSSANPVLSVGEFGFEIDTLKLKVGNGLTAWNTLTYVGATTAEITAAVDAAIAEKADLNSPTFTGLTDFEGVVDFSEAIVVGLPETAPISIHSFAMIG